MFKLDRLTGASLLCLTLCAPGLALAQADYPSKPVTMVVSTAAGGPTDVEVRLYGTKMQEFTGQPFVMEFRPGAGNAIATGYVAKAAPDGYTLLVNAGAFTIFPALYKDLPFDTLKDFAPISQMSQKPFVLLTNPNFPAKNIGDVIAYMRANPGKLNYGTSGAGGGGHLIGAWISSATNTRLTFIHYKGIAPQMADLAEGRLDIVPAALLPAMPLIKSGKLRALAMTGLSESPQLPGVGTISAFIPGFNYTTWLGYVAPVNTPPAIVNRLATTFARVAKSPDVIAKLGADGLEMVGSTPAQFKQMLVTETAQWSKIIRDAGIKLEE